jgi:pimeloyl-ACP methyl ester carboxylesterase
MRTVALVVVLALTACIAPQPTLRPVTGDDVTIFVHGYRASFLATESGEVAFVTVAQGLSEGDRSLALPFEGQRPFAKYGPLHTTGPLTRLVAIPLVFEVDAYASFMDWARDALPGFTVFAYDWRRDIRDSSKELCALIEKQGPGRRVRIIGHSMGGLVTLHCLLTGGDAVKNVTAVVLAAAPLRGAPAQWDDLHLGTLNQRNSHLIDREALLTFPSAWQLLPPKPDFFVDGNGSPTIVPAYDPATWQTRKWGLFAEPGLPGAYVEELRARVDAHRALWSVFEEAERAPAPKWKTMLVVGKGRDTVSGWKVSADGGFDFSKPLVADGDGTVLSTSVRPPASIKATVVETTGEHAELLRRSEVQAVIADFLR